MSEGRDNQGRFAPGWGGGTGGDNGGGRKPNQVRRELETLIGRAVKGETDEDGNPINAGEMAFLSLIHI